MFTPAIYFVNVKGEDIGNLPNLGLTRSRGNANNELYIESGHLTGIFEDNKAQFKLNLSFWVYNNNTTVKIPLIGPPTRIMVNNLTIDGYSKNIGFDQYYYFYSGKLATGLHYLEFIFSTHILPDEIIELEIVLYGPILNYEIDFVIPFEKNEKIYIYDLNDGIESTTENKMLLHWDFFALEQEYWTLSWIKYITPSDKDITCDFTSEVQITDKKATILVTYDLEFNGFAFDRLLIADLDQQLVLKYSNLGLVEYTNDGIYIMFDYLVIDKLHLKLTFEKRVSTGNDKQLEIKIPRPLNCKLNGEVALFSDLNIVVELLEKENTTLVGYSGKMKSNANFIGNYMFNEHSSLIFKISFKESLVTAEIIDTLMPTYDGYEIITWILFGFYGNSPSSITMDLPVLSTNGKPYNPQLLNDYYNSLPILDYNWNNNLNRLTLWLEANISDEFRFGLKWQLPGNNVTMSEIQITDVSVLNYHVVYYLENGILYDHIYETGIVRTGYDSVPKSLQQMISSGSNLEVYKVQDGYTSVLYLNKDADLYSEIFYRVWVNEAELELRQIIRIMSENMITGTFSYKIPSQVSSLDVKNCASWTVFDELLIIYPITNSNGPLTFYIEATLSNQTKNIIPFLPLNIKKSIIYTMFGSASNLNLTVEPTDAESMNPDELPEYFSNEIKTNKAVKMYYSSSETSPVFLIESVKYTKEEAPTTIIELAQITVIRSLDGKIAVKTIYMLKNIERVDMHVKLPKNAVVWMALVGGKAIPIIQHGTILTIPLLRSTITGQNIAFSVEIVYLTIEPSIELEFILPKADVEILNLKVNIGLPTSVRVKDPEKYNPNFELESWDKWKSKVPRSEGTGSTYSDYAQSMNFQLGDVSFDKSQDEPDWIYVGFENFNEDTTNVIDIERIDSQGDGNNKFEVNVDSSNSFYDPGTDMTYAKISLTQGQYEFSNLGVQRQVTVLGGNYQQVSFGSDYEFIATPVPPLQLQLPESGQVIRLSAIFIKANENTSIRLVEGQDDTDDGQFELKLPRNICYFGISIGLILIILIVVAVILKDYKTKEIKQNKITLSESRLKNSREGKKIKKLRKDNRDINIKTKEETKGVTKEPIVPKVPKVPEEQKEQKGQKD